jgi:hypothetical protein
VPPASLTLKPSGTSFYGKAPQRRSGCKPWVVDAMGSVAQEPAPLGRADQETGAHRLSVREVVEGTHLLQSIPFESYVGSAQYQLGGPWIALVL